MIFDKIENIKNYSEIPLSVIDFILKLDENHAVGHVKLSDGGEIYANIDEYTTKPLENCRFEAHRKYIDIQLLLMGEEVIETAFTGELEIAEPYDADRDVMFLKDTDDKTVLHLKKGYFALFYPTDAHKPQIAINAIDNVKKVVVKMAVS